jgi:aldose 1-epimerase
MLPDPQHFQSCVNGKPTNLFLLRNKGGMEAAITNYGGRLVSLLVPGPEGKSVDVAVGFASLQEYIDSAEPYYGATIGRVGNRIAKGRLTVEGETWQLSVNNGPNTLHGGKQGFESRVWTVEEEGSDFLTLSYHSPDGEEGFRGNLEVRVTYRLSEDNAFHCIYEAHTDRLTPVSLTNHAYFNLNGEGSGPVTGHRLQLNADRYTPVDKELIPTGELTPVAGTPFDFLEPRPIGEKISEQDLQLQHGGGYDHNFVLRREGEGLQWAARVEGEQSGIRMEVLTEEPGVQFYSGNFMEGAHRFKSGAEDAYRTAFCLETQHFPDAPNQPSFPSILLRPGERYQTRSVYRFSC